MAKYDLFVAYFLNHLITNHENQKISGTTGDFSKSDGFRIGTAAEILAMGLHCSEDPVQDPQYSIFLDSQQGQFNDCKNMFNIADNSLYVII